MSMLLLLMCLVAAVSANSVENMIRKEWEVFKSVYGKYYSNQSEEQERLQEFVKNKQHIEAHNLRYALGYASYRLRPNQYTDWSHQHFIATMNGYNKTLNKSRSLRSSAYFPAVAGLAGVAAQAAVPEHIDWRDYGAVTDVRNQGDCGACWAFTATGALESQLFLKTGKLVPLSVQSLLDCAVDEQYTVGCSGGANSFWAYAYIMEYGIGTEQEYPYEGTDNKSCRHDDVNNSVAIWGVGSVRPGDEQHMKEVVGTVGPVAAGVCFSDTGFRFHSGEDVYYEEETCEDLNHEVLVVGYGTDPRGGDYWLVKNSWGTSWGDRGYVKMARNRNNNCGIASYASYPLVW